MRVLVVEDEVHLAQSLARGLTAEGFDVEVVHDGTDGLWRAREHSYGAIVLDLLLPGMNGYKVCRTLRAEHGKAGRLSSEKGQTRGSAPSDPRPASPPS